MMPFASENLGRLPSSKRPGASTVVWALLAWASSVSVAGVALGPTSTNEELIRQLQTAELEDQRAIQNPWNSPRLLPLGAAGNIGSRENPLYVAAPSLTELVRRGVNALPALLAHLSDARPTGIVFALAPRMGTRRAVISGDDYDDRYSDRARQPAAVNTKEKDPLGGDGTYRVKVGDLCYVAVGEIVNRQLHVVLWYGEGGGWPAGAGIGAKIWGIASPVERPALAAATRADWAGLTEKEHAQSLLDQFTASANGFKPDLEAFDRLLLYYPAEGARAVEDLLTHNPHAGAKEAVVKELAWFRKPELNAMLYRVYQDAVAAQESALKTQPPGTWDPGVDSLGSTLPLDCAALLVHQGHDDEFRAFTLDRIRRIKEADEHPAAQPAATMPGPRIDTLRLVHNYELECCNELLSRLDEDSAGPPPPGGNAQAMPRPTLGAQATVESVEMSRGGDFGPLVIRFGIFNTSTSRVQAARVVVTRALDDSGVRLEQTADPRFSYVAVGRISDDILMGLPPPSLTAELTSPSKPAKHLAILEGWVEAVVPDLDRDSVATVANVTAKVGEPLDTAAFRRAGLTVTVFNKEACDRYRQEKGPVLTDSKTPTIYGIPVPGSPGGTEMSEQDLAVQVRDEGGRLISTEFRTKDGSPIRYNHNGFAHYGSLPGTRLDLYHFDAPLPGDAQMVCLLVTPKALVVAPFKVSGLALP